MEERIQKLYKKREELKKKHYSTEEALEYSSISSEISACKMILELRKKKKKTIFWDVNFKNPKILKYV